MLLVLANPVLVWAVVAGAHNDAQAVVFAGAALTLFGTYGMAGPRAFDQIEAASQFISSGSQWRLIFEPLRDLIPEDLAHAVIFWAALASMVLMAVLLARTLPAPP